MTTIDSPADIICQLLKDLSLISEQVGTSKTKWLARVSQQPETPDRVVTTYDTTAKEDGRLTTGERINHPGIQIRIRAEDYVTGRAKAAEIGIALDAVLRKTVTPASVKYRVEAITRKEPTYLGPDDKQRYQFVINLTITLTLLS